MPNNFYNDNAGLLARQYLSTSFEEVHASWMPHLNQLFNGHLASLTILDIGAGIGRDAKYLAERGAKTLESHQNDRVEKVDVIAVEPAHMLAELGKKYTKGLNITWVSDSLPELNRLSVYQNGFNLILLSAVWMHIPPNERVTALKVCERLLAPHGKLIISLRHGPNSDARVMHPVSAEELQGMSSSLRLTIVESSERDTDKLGRTQVFWETVVLQRTNDSVAKD